MKNREEFFATIPRAKGENLKVSLVKDDIEECNVIAENFNLVLEHLFSTCYPVVEELSDEQQGKIGQFLNRLFSHFCFMKYDVDEGKKFVDANISKFV